MGDNADVCMKRASPPVSTAGERLPCQLISLLILGFADYASLKRRSGKLSGFYTLPYLAAAEEKGERGFIHICYAIAVMLLFKII